MGRVRKVTPGICLRTFMSFFFADDLTPVEIFTVAIITLYWEHLLLFSLCQTNSPACGVLLKDIQTLHKNRGDCLKVDGFPPNLTSTKLESVVCDTFPLTSRSGRCVCGLGLFIKQGKKQAHL